MLPAGSSFAVSVSGGAVRGKLDQVERAESEIAE
jgi:hypothetical protein